jgi:predicted phage baseplate assembly protein
LLSRPLGLKEVVNRDDAQGAEDPESRDDARKNAPLTVLTLDRAVSLQDYEDFARAFAGVAKAQAVWVWDGRKRSVFITVAGPDAAALDEEGTVVTSLKEALRSYGDPYVAFTVKSYSKVLFRLSGSVTIGSDRVIDKVMADVAATLRRAYAFELRQFGQSVALSEIVAVIQSIAGVVAVDIDKFHRSDKPSPPLKFRLDAESPAMGADGIVPAAELLLLDEATLNQLAGVP